MSDVTDRMNFFTDHCARNISLLESEYVSTLLIAFLTQARRVESMLNSFVKIFHLNMFLRAYPIFSKSHMFCTFQPLTFYWQTAV